METGSFTYSATTVVQSVPILSCRMRGDTVETQVSNFLQYHVPGHTGMSQFWLIVALDDADLLVPLPGLFLSPLFKCTGILIHV